MNISIIDYGMGNLRSISNALNHICDENIIVTNDKDEIMNSDALILPGVGAYRDAMINLKEYGLIDVLNDAVLNNKKPILGICLGMQLLFSDSEEGGKFEGLNWIDGNVILMKPGDEFRIPHVGWNELIIKKDGMLDHLGSDKNFYFVHSYYAKTDEKYITSTFEYGQEFTASVEKDNIWGMQFHPEKSQKNGFQLLKNFINFCEENKC